MSGCKSLLGQVVVHPIGDEEAQWRLSMEYWLLV